MATLTSSSPKENFFVNTPLIFFDWLSCDLGIALVTLTLESEIDVGQGITIGPGKLVKKNKHRALKL